MDKLTSILAVLDGSSNDVSLLAKAARLALAFGARIELFSCDSEHAYVARRSDDARAVHDALEASVREQCRYLRRRAENIGMQHLAVSVDASCETPIYEGVVRKVFGSRPDLVIKATSGSGGDGRSTLGPSDWQLVRTCPAPLLLSRRPAWAARPRFAAAVDESNEDTAGLAALVIRSAELMRVACGGELELLFAESVRPDEPPLAACPVGAAHFASEERIDSERIRPLRAGPETPEQVPTQGLELLVLGLLSRRTNLTRLIGTLNNQLLESLDSDILLIRPSNGSTSRRSEHMNVLSVPAASDARIALTAPGKRCEGVTHEDPLRNRPIAEV